MIPIGSALEDKRRHRIDRQPASSAWLKAMRPGSFLPCLVVVTMTLSDVMNNTATAVIAAPIAVDIASRLGTSMPTPS